MLWKKAVRDLKDSKASYLACTAVIFIGLVVFSSFSIVMDNLDVSQRNFYRTQRFADGFAEVEAMPGAEVEKLRNLEGVADIQGRLVKEARVLLPGREESVYLRLISVDPAAENPINGMELMQGIPLERGEMNIWVDNKFFKANHLKLNQEIEVIVEGKKKDLRIVGFGRSPEFIYALRSSTDLYPNPARFGIAFVPYEAMRALFAAGKTVNDLVFTLRPGADYLALEQMLEPELKPYGLKRIYPRKDQISHFMLTQELNGLRSTARTLPLLFLSVAALILYIMLRRMVEQQREQIGILKALGYTDREILLHYMVHPLIVGAAGGLTGWLAGIALSFPFTTLYQMFFNMPGLESRFSPVYFLLSILLSLTFSGFAGYQGCKGVLALKPVEAMRPPAPPVAAKALLERFPLIWGMFTVQGKMALRNISRNKRRSLFVFAGITFAFSLGGLTWALQDMSEQMLLAQYEKVQTYNIKVDLAHPLDQEKATRELARFPGVKSAEPVAEIPVTLKNEWREKDVVLLGLPQDGRLYNILDKGDRRVAPPRNGVLISERLARLLGAGTGTQLTVASLMMRGPEEKKKVEVVGVIPQYLGLNAYMEIEAAGRLLGQENLATGVMLLVDEQRVPLLQREYNSSSAIAGFVNRAEMFNQVQELLASYSGTILIFALMAVVTGFAIIYNSSTITLSERSRELASMMVLGMTPAEALAVITFEQWVISIFAMLAGIPLTKLLLAGMAQALSTDIYTMPAEMSGLSAVVAFFITAASIWIAQRMAAKKVDRLSLVEVLKSRE
ncbi:MAG: FtsX-like permease family protein [Bacillota bacterium]|nr:FtsX-like permease family protein [Bacillota bacterium]